MHRVPLLLVCSILAAVPLVAQNCPRGLLVAERMISATVSEAIYGDFDGDHRADVAFIESIDRVVALNRGPLFEPVFASPDTLTGPLQTADLNGDGRLDLIYPNGDRDSIRAELGNGDGIFSAPYIAWTRPGAETLLARRFIDFDHDGRGDYDDLRETSTVEQPTLRFLRAAGDGTFKEIANPVFARPGGPLQTSHFALGDFD